MENQNPAIAGPINQAVIPQGVTTTPAPTVVVAQPVMPSQPYLQSPAPQASSGSGFWKWCAIIFVIFILLVCCLCSLLLFLPGAILPMAFKASPNSTNFDRSQFTTVNENDLKGSGPLLANIDELNANYIAGKPATISYTEKDLAVILFKAFNLNSASSKDVIFTDINNGQITAKVKLSALLNALPSETSGSTNLKASDYEETYVTIVLKPTADGTSLELTDFDFGIPFINSFLGQDLKTSFNDGFQSSLKNSAMQEGIEIKNFRIEGNQLKMDIQKL